MHMPIVICKVLGVAGLVGPHEVGQMLGVSRQRVSQLAARGDFPTPVAVLRMGTVWRVEDVRAWAEATGRPVREP
jgi:predicted DNA-binding transcriptional regulator AlpA